jgi:LysR family glycine cleavage system transcriptional activator
MSTDRRISASSVAIGPDVLVSDDIAVGRLIAPFGFVPNGLSMYVLYPKSRVQNSQLTALRDWLIEAGKAWLD